jgi:hypothetical protein
MVRSSQMIDLMIATALFVLAMTVLHILLFTRWKGKSASFWKSTDYCWLMLAVDFSA